MISGSRESDKMEGYPEKRAKKEPVEQKPFLVQLTEFLDVVGKHGIGVAMVGMGMLYVLFIHPESNSWQNIVAYSIAVPAIIFGAYMEYRKISKEK